MAELAAGAVSSLLSVIRNEALLLGGVQSDVQFIKEEMESMNSFLAHLARSAPPGGEHDEQVRTWMNQVRFLAQDCNNCIDLYLYRGNPDVQRARGRIRRYLWWVYWFLHKLVAQHQAAIQLRELKERARDVGERRLRYGVEVPAKSAAAEQSPRAAGRSSSAQPFAPAATGGYAAGDDDEDGDDQYMLATATHHSGRRAYFEPRTLDDYVEAKLLEWQKEIPTRARVTLSLAIMAPAAHMDVLALAHETLVFHPGFRHRTGYHLMVVVDIPSVHPDFLPLRPKEVLFYILHELKLKHSTSQSHEEDTDQGKGEEEEEEEEEEKEDKEEEEEEKEEDEEEKEEEEEDNDDDLDSWQVYNRKLSIYREKKRVLNKIKENIAKMKINKKLDKIQRDIQTRPAKGQQKKGTDQQDPDVHVLLKQLLWSSAAASQPDQLKNKDMPKLSASDNTILAVAKKLKEHMEADEESEVGEREGKEAGVGRRGLEKEVLGEEREGGGEGKEIVQEEEREGGGGRGGEAVDDEEEDNDDDDDHYEDDDEEEMQQMAPIYLDEAQYVHILRQAFPKSTSSNKSATKQATNTILGEDQIKQMIHESRQEILRLLYNGKSDKNQETGERGTPGQNTEDVFTEIIEQKMDKIKQEFKEQMKIKGLVDDIKHELKYEFGYKCPLFVLKVDETVDLPIWEDTRNVLSLLGCSADVLIVTDTKDIQQAKEYCYPQREPIDYSLGGLYYETVLQITSQQKNVGNYDPQIFRNILEECEPHEFCMKLFTHTMYINPKKSNEELIKLLSTLQASPKSFEITANKMFKFSYNDLPKEYKSCLLYLAIFPPEHKIKRSTLIGRWVAEGLIVKEDWPSSVHRANRCFDMLINRWLVCPADIAATGKAKSCAVGHIIHGFITKIARKQHIVETRLSGHLARHFSIFNDLHLRNSDKIEKFFQTLSRSPRISLLKVLDLEGCQQCFGEKNQRYLKDICSKMLLLKYLSLRGTDANQLPTEINKLRELEVLDIRQTKVPVDATKNVLLLKLKRLLAGHIYPSPSSSNNSTTAEGDKFSSVRIPEKIGKMVNVELLSNVKAQHSGDLKDIGKLWQLRKLGVVIEDKDRHLKSLMRTISDLHECLRSLSITLPIVRCECTPPSSGELSADICSRLRHPPKLLESLSISGNTQKGCLLPLFAKDGNNKLAKVTLSSTSLDQYNLKVLTKLPTLQCISLRCIEFTENMLTFEKEEFRYLKYLHIEGSNLTEIIFGYGAGRELEKMVLSFTNIESASGVECLQKFEELELNNNSNSSRLLSSFDIAKQIAKLTLRGTLLDQGALQILAKKPNMRCLVLLDCSCEVRQITFSNDEFPNLSHLIVHCSAITKIFFTAGSAPKLEKIVWSSTILSGINNLPRLKELEFNGDPVPNGLQKAIKKHKNIPTLKHNKPEIHDQAKGDEKEDDDDAARFPFCWKNQV